MWGDLKRYRRMVTVKSGERILFRPLTKEDKPALLELFERAEDTDLAYCRNNLRDDSLIASWVDNLDLSQVFPLVALVNERIVGDATLHLGENVNRHIGWIRIFLDPEYRRKGIGTDMLKTLIEIAHRIGLQQVVAEVVSNQVQAMKAVESLGFKREYRHQDYYVFEDEEVLDLVVYVLRLAPPPGQF